jgi:hypothetical protein
VPQSTCDRDLEEKEQPTTYLKLIIILCSPKVMKHASLPLQHLHSWTHFNSVDLFAAEITSHIIGDDGSDKGGGLRATTKVEPGAAVLAAPIDLVLSKDRVVLYSKADQRLKELLDATPRSLQVGCWARAVFR